ncbi:MAG: cyclopropane-fatty-acyl-phospholipid synthase family protein [Gemmatimonadota bacterium]
MATLAAPATATTLDLVQDIFNGVEPRDFAVRLWDGTSWTPEGAEAPAVTLVLEHPGALRRLLVAGSEAALAEAYLTGDVGIEGDLFAVAAVGRGIMQRRRGVAERARLAVRALGLPRGSGFAPGQGAGGLVAPVLGGARHSLARDRAAVTHHYDLSNRFYALFLDPRMVYSCAVFAHPDEDLEAAQLRKLDLICRKLRLTSGKRLLDIGCGWGALILHAAAAYGVEALGVTLSERQAEEARARIRAAGLEDRCRVEVRDYRTLDDGDGFDHVASVGMFEHVGSNRAAEYFATIHRLLRPGGTYLHHAITGNPQGAQSVGETLSQRFVFPDHELIPLGRTLTFADEAGFDVRDVENLREHYALTLRRWVAALEDRHEEAAAEVGEATWRAWRLVFAGAGWQFEAGHHGLVQALLSKPTVSGAAGLPLERRDWYEAAS